MIKDVRALCKTAIKIDREYQSTHKLHLKKKKRILRRAIKIDQKIQKVLRNMYPMYPKKDILKVAHDWMAWMEERITNRRGRIIQNPMSRTERRLWTS